MVRRLLFYNFRFIFTLDRWIRRRFTKAGLLVLGGTIAAGIFGIDTRQTLSYQLFSLLFVLLLFAYLSSWFFRIQLTAHRILPKFVTVGETTHYRIQITNHTAQIQADLSLLEDVQLHPPSFEDFLQAKEPIQHKRNWFDDYVGYPRWIWLMSLSKGADIFPVPLFSLPTKSEKGIDLKVFLTPLRRGYVHFNSVTFTRPDPFGLFNALYTYPLMDTLLVLPKRYPVKPIFLSGSRCYQRGGVQLAMSVGDAEEFVSLRDYRPGDSLRHIHWKSLAKLGKPVIKEFQDEFFVRHALILDTFTTRRTAQHFEAAVSVAASLVSSPRSQEILLDLLFVGTQAYCFTEGRGLAQTENLLEVLACVEASDQPFEQLYPLVNDHNANLSSAICVLLNWDTARQELVRSLKSSGIALLVIVVSNTEVELTDEYDEVHVLQFDALAEGLAQL